MPELPPNYPDFTPSYGRFEMDKLEVFFLTYKPAMPKIVAKIGEPGNRTYWIECQEWPNCDSWAPYDTQARRGWHEYTCVENGHTFTVCKVYAS